MDREPLVTVIIPTYNRRDILPRSINSVLTQTYKKWELIIIDDRSTDNTKEIVKKYMENDKRIRCCDNKHKKGPAGARNQGIEEAKGEFIAFLDSDDEWKPWHVQEIMEEFDKNPDVDWIYADNEREKDGEIIVKSVFKEYWTGKNKITVKKKEKINILAGKDLITDILKHSSYAGCQVSIIQKKVFSGINFDESFFYGGVEDRLAPLEAIAKGFRLAYLENIHLTYHIHAGSISTSDPNKDVDEKLKIYKELERLYKILPEKLSLKRKQQKIIKEKLADVYFWEIGYNCLFKKKDYKQAKKYFLKALKLKPFKLKYWGTFISKIPYYVSSCE